MRKGKTRKMRKFICVERKVVELPLVPSLPSAQGLPDSANSADPERKRASLHISPKREGEAPSLSLKVGQKVGAAEWLPL